MSTEGVEDPGVFRAEFERLFSPTGMHIRAKLKARIARICGALFLRPATNDEADTPCAGYDACMEAHVELSTTERVVILRGKCADSPEAAEIRVHIPITPAGVHAHRGVRIAVSFEGMEISDALWCFLQKCGFQAGEITEIVRDFVDLYLEEQDQALGSRRRVASIIEELEIEAVAPSQGEEIPITEEKSQLMALLVMRRILRRDRPK